MEHDIEKLTSPVFHKKKFQDQLDKIRQASERAQEKIDYYTAHDEHILHAIQVVEEFLKKKHRICYGGQALNAHLPTKYKFYDPEYSIPDYDFFTPSQNEDIAALVKELKRAGFTEISAREGMHKGTVKIYVDYVPVADMTEIDRKLYNILSSRESRMNGISYLDANTLRMLMYLELSRPRGELKRWEKVYERLLLFNEFLPPTTCNKSKHTQKGLHGSLTEEQVHTVLSFIVENDCVFAGADLMHLYEDAVKQGRTKYSRKHTRNWLVSSRKPIVFFSSDPAKHAQEVVYGLQADSSSAFTIKTHASKDVDLIPSLTIIHQGKQLCIIIVHQSACQSYFTVALKKNNLKIASMDSLIMLYFSLGLFKSAFFDMGSMECLAEQLVQLSIRARSKPDAFSFPFISIKCVGHQRTIASLIRSKVKRITKKKRELKDILEHDMPTNLKAQGHLKAHKET
jgi:hypothetical protein